MCTLLTKSMTCSGQCTNCKRSSNRFFSGALSTVEHQKLEGAVKSFLSKNSWPENQADQAALGQAFAVQFEQAAPRITRILKKARDGKFDAAYITGFPIDPAHARLALITMTEMLGKAFNYDGQNNGALVMELKPNPNSVGNTNDTPGEFAPHTDDAAVPHDLRTDFINLYGIVNPPGTLTSYAPAWDALKELAVETVEILRDKRFKVGFPASFGLGRNIWSSPCSIINIGDDGDIELRFPSYATEPVDPNDHAARQAINALKEALERNMISVPLDAGSLLCLNNSRGAHSRGAIRDGDRLVLRTYAARSLQALQEVTGTPGPIFAIRPIVKMACA